MQQPASPVTPAPVIISVHVVTYDNDGPRAMRGGVCPLLAQALAQASMSEHSGVVKRNDVLDPLGQDIYDVSFAAILRLRGLFNFMTYPEIDDIQNTWPETFKYAFVVSR